MLGEAQSSVQMVKATPNSALGKLFPVKGSGVSLPMPSLLFPLFDGKVLQEEIHLCAHRYLEHNERVNSKLCFKHCLVLHK